MEILKEWQDAEQMADLFAELKCSKFGFPQKKKLQMN